MNAATSALLLVACVVLVHGARIARDDKFTTKYDNVDLDEILRNERLFQNYATCLTDVNEDKCTADAKELRRAIPDALTNDCAKCSEKQKNGSVKVIKFIVVNKPDLWTDLEKKYDPNGSYRKRNDELFTKL